MGLGAFERVFLRERNPVHQPRHRDVHEKPLVDALRLHRDRPERDAHDLGLRGGVGIGRTVALRFRLAVAEDAALALGRAEA